MCFAFLYVKANSKKICEEVSFPSFFQKNAFVSIFVKIQGQLSQKIRSYPYFSLYFLEALAKIQKP